MSRRVPIHMRGGAVRCYALIDSTDYDLVASRRWSLDRDGYVRDSSKARRFMHRLILGVTDPALHCDHVNRDKLDNRRHNLRLVSVAENNQNVSAIAGASLYRGVGRHQGLWAARIQINGRRLYLGSFQDEVVAARVAAQARALYMPQITEPHPELVSAEVAA